MTGLQGTGCVPWAKVACAVGGICGLLLGVFVSPASAAEKKKKPFVLGLEMYLSETYDDNVYQSAVGESDYVTEAKPGISAELNAIPLLTAQAQYNLRYLFYPGHSDLTDLFHEFGLDLGLDFNQAKRFKNFRISTEVNYDPVRISSTNSSGTAINTTQRLSAALVPGYTFKFTPTLDLDTEVRIQRTQFFDEGESSSAGDLSLTLRKRIGRRLYARIGGNGTYQKFDNVGTTLVFGGNAGLDIEILRRLNGGLSLGYQIIDLPTGGTGDAITVGANVEYLFTKRTTFTLLVDRSNTVDINNNDFVATTANFNIRHRLSRKTLLGLDLGWDYIEQNTPITFQVLSDNLTSLSAALRMQYRDRWTFGLKASQDENGGAFRLNDYTQNRYMVEVKYHFPISF